MENEQKESVSYKTDEKEKVVILFAGDSGDGMQLTGNQFTQTVASFGNDIVTLPVFPSEIRAPAGSISGVSGFQVQFGQQKIHTPGDFCDVLIAMNPAALFVNLENLHSESLVIIDNDAFTSANLKKIGFSSIEELFDCSELKDKEILRVPITSQTVETLKTIEEATKKQKERCKNFFSLGMILWLYDKSPEYILKWIKEKFKTKPVIAKMNINALQAGMVYAYNSGFFKTRHVVCPAELEEGTYRSITGNEATALGLLTGSIKAGLKLFVGAYPITPATDILHFLVTYKNFGVKALQAEDEIAGICSAIGASYMGLMGVTTTSGPGLSLKSEALGLAVMTELPLVCVNVQRGGPSTGLPTKTEQADLRQALYGRHGEAPLPVLAATSPTMAFYMAIEAIRIATQYMTPVILLSDSYIGNGAEPFRIPDVASLPSFPVKFRSDPEGYMPYKRNTETLARDWAIAGTPGLEHCIGGLEKDAETGAPNQTSKNHEKMVNFRKDKIEGIANSIPLLDVFGEESTHELLVVGWGSTFGMIRNIVNEYKEQGKAVAHVQFSYIHPLPKNTEEILLQYKKILVVELNSGQFQEYLQSQFVIKMHKLTKTQGKPFTNREIREAIDKLL